ncbi:MAG: DHH family phosphoesterase [Nitrososphaeria archaeon]|nr:DHH family phosphoesterase [Nitrososphaeria archaeon]NDB88054.1 DHH family phosphoesterase [Nitrososphaerota archaeon]NDF34711.1 DHH family phosphoesterase [Nitrosopumilaceae archaeon]NDF24518.1 DHH family phosphoesterase [Nitrososphaerota archaeon]NDF28741.1 DHH family phosphoesterase [Nitrososphaeria archaeon]
MGKNLDQHLSNFSDRILDHIRNGKDVSVTTHIDCDGLTSGAIITKALIRAGAKITVRTTKEMSLGVVKSMQSDSRDFHIVTDLGGGFAKQFDESLGENWFVLDHHEILEEEHDNERVINAWKYGIDGGTEICAGGMAFLAAKALDKRNSDLAPIAVVSALGDRQDQGERKSFLGKNAEIIEEAKSLGRLQVDMDMLLVGRETRPLIDALAFTSQPFIEGLTWNRDACLALFKSSGIELKDGGRWRTPSDLTDDEKRLLIESITKFASSQNASQIMEELIGHTYTFPAEERRSFLRDAREFSTMLNSCGRISRSGVGISICMGDRNKMLQEGENILLEYRKLIRDYMNILTNERWRISDSARCVMVNAEGVVPETMTGTISSLLAGSPKNAGKIIILRTNGEENTIKFSSRKSIGCKTDVNLSSLMKSGAEKFNGIGGGHDAAAGAKITKDKLDGFLDYLEDSVNGNNSQNSN